MPRSKFSIQQKVDLLAEYNNSQVKRTTFAKKYGISPSTFKRWLALFKRDGIDGLKEREKNQLYSYEFKLKVVRAFLNGQGTLEELVNRYGLRNIYQVHDWVFKYNNGKLFARIPQKKEPIMKRKITFEERIKVVDYVVKDNHSYHEAAEHFSVSYQQVRLWVIKSKENGYEALRDGRGHRKAHEDLTDLDKANLKIRQLESQLRDQKIIEEFAKKLQELQHKG